MEAVRPPPLIPSLEGADPTQGLTQDCFRSLFQYLYVEAHWYANLPGRHTLKVSFRPDHFDHAFYKESRPGQPRSLWKPERAERLLWVGHTIENPCEVYQMRASRLSLFCRLADREAPWYLVVVDRTGEWVASFVTAYPLGHRDAAGMRRLGTPLGR